MSKQRDNLRGHKVKPSDAALLLIDLINDLEFEGGDKLAANILPLTENIASLKRRTKAAGIPVIYVNDNFGKWQSDFRKLLEHCINDRVRGTPLVKRLQPEPDDYFVLKPKHSGFYSTTLDILLRYLGSKTLILAGVTGDLCILFTAADAHMRDYHLIIPSDCIASETDELNAHALELMAKRLDAEVSPSTTLDVKELNTNNLREERKQRSRPH